MRRQRVLMMVLALGCGLPQLAEADSYDLYYDQTGALLQYSQAQTIILHAAVTASVFDPKITRETVEELRRALQLSKRNLDRSIALLPKRYARQEAALEKLRTKLRACEDTLTKVANDIDEQTGRGEPDGGDETRGELGTRIDDDEPEAAAPKANWDLLKRGVAWVHTDLVALKKTYGGLARKIGIKPLRRLKRPAGKHP